MGPSLGQALGQVFEEMRVAKLRFALNLTAFVIGGACLVVLASLVTSANLLLKRNELEAHDTVALTISPGPAPQRQAGRTRRALEGSDAAALAASPHLRAGTVSAERETMADVFFRDRGATVRVTGGTSAILGAHGLTVAQGRFWSPVEQDRGARVAVVGATILRELIDASELTKPVSVRIEGRQFTVIGALASKPSAGAEGPWAYDERILVPWTAFRSSFQAVGSDRVVSKILWQPDAPADESQLAPLFARAKGLIGTMLLTRSAGVRNFRIEDPGGAEQSQLVAWIVAALLLSTALVSFVVGGFTITNAALASVAERQREIGVKRALGASPLSIGLELMLETAVTASIGGLLSMSVGLVLAEVAGRVAGHYVAAWQLIVPGWSLVCAGVMALLVGAVAGLYPAWRAGRLHPVQALRGD